VSLGPYQVGHGGGAMDLRNHDPSIACESDDLIAPIIPRPRASMSAAWELGML
jgi:hypothetical protein